MEDVCLDNGLELTADQGTGILQYIVGPNRMDGESVGVGRLQTQSIDSFIVFGPSCVGNMPNVLDDAEQDGVQYFDRCIPGWIKP